MNHDEIEAMLKLLKKHNVRVADWANGQLYKVEFFPSTGDVETAAEKKPLEDEKVDPETGLTKSQSRDLLNMDR